MNSVTLKFSYKFKRYLAICNKVFSNVDEIRQKEYKKLMNLLEKYKLFYIYKHFFIDYPNKHLKLPSYRIKSLIALYKQKTIDINEFSTLPFYHNTQEKAIYYVYADNPVNWSLSIHNSIKSINNGRTTNKPTHNLIRDLLLTPIDDLQYQLMFLDDFREDIVPDDINNVTSTNKKTNEKSKMEKLLSLRNKEFIFLFEMHQLYQKLVNINHKLQNTKHIKEIDIIFEDYLKDVFTIIYYPNNKDFVYKILVIWEHIIRKYDSHKEWIELVDEINNLLENKTKLRSLINKTKSKLKTFNDLLTVSHTVS